MSLQLLYSMFDLKTRSQLEKENFLSNENLDKACSDRLGNSTTSTTPSGYETGSDLTVDEKTCNNKNSEQRNKKQKKQRKVRKEKVKNKSPTSPIGATVPKAGTSLKEIIEAQRSGSYLLSNPEQVKELAIETRVKYLKKEICQQKKAIDEELVKIAVQQFGIVEPGRCHHAHA